MPWCPKCKNEYREGFTHCSECNVTLVDDLSIIEATEKELVFTTEHKEKIDAFIKYLEYSGIHSYSAEPDENDFVWSLYVAKDDYKKASKLFTGFAITESERAIAEQSVEIITSDEEILPDDLEYSDIVNDNTTDTDTDSDYQETTDDDLISDNASQTIDTIDSENDSDNDTDNSDSLTADKNDDISEERQKAIDELNERMEFNEMSEAPSATYVRKTDKAKDYLSSAYTNIICGVIGLVFIILNMVGVISLVTSLFSQIVFLVLFAVFLVSGIKMYFSSKAIAAECDLEEETEKSIIEWLDNNITSEYLESIRDDSASDEINYFNFCENIRTKVREVFPDADASMIESLIDEHLTKFN